MACCKGDSGCAIKQQQEKVYLNLSNKKKQQQLILKQREKRKNGMCL